MDNSKLIIQTLKQSAAALENQDQQTAIRSLDKITAEVVAFQKEAATLKTKTAASQKESVAQLSKILKLKGEAYADHQETKKGLNLAYSQVASKKVSIGDLNQRIANNNQELKNSEKKLRQNEARIRDLNNDSAGSIFVSIVTLGMDRAVKAIGIEIDGVKDQIKNTKNTIRRLEENRRSLEKELARDENEVSRLEGVIKKKADKIKDLEYEEFRLQNKERMKRKKVVFFTEINLFYIQLQNVLTNVTNKINNVKDIVSLLDNQTPTIASFDPCKEDLLTLEEALLLFGNHLDNKISMESTIPVFNENRWYRFTTEWLGKAKSLDIVNAGKKNQLIMTKTGSFSGQYWKIKSLGNGYFRLTTNWLKDGKSLDVVNDGINNKVIMDNSGSQVGQFWKIEPEFGFFRLTTKWLGERKSLGVKNDGKNNNQLMLSDAGDFSEQHWNITMI